MSADHRPSLVLELAPGEDVFCLECAQPWPCSATSSVVYSDDLVTLHHGDSRKVLSELLPESVDAVVTDPPYELGFMGKGWDSSGIAYDVDLWRECLRVLKPGGHLLAFGGTRTYHRMVCAIEDAGFEIRDSIHWLYGSGFPKSLDVSKAIDKAAGAERVNGARAWSGGSRSGGMVRDSSSEVTTTRTIYDAPATPDAERWQGWGTALKPAHEPIVVARKPLAGTVAGNVLTHGVGGLNIDACRIGTEERLTGSTAPNDMRGGNFGSGHKAATDVHMYAQHAAGRWPANIVITHTADCRQIGEQAETFSGSGQGSPPKSSSFVAGSHGNGGNKGTTIVPVFDCAPDCPAATLDQQSGHVGAAAPASGPTYSGPSKSGSMAGAFAGMGDKPATFHGDTGGASRFFTTTEWHPEYDAPFYYSAKAGNSERPKHEDTGRGHATVKPLALMRWLVRLVTPPGGIVLDPFAGSGTTLEAATVEGFNSIGIELEGEHISLILERLNRPVQLGLNL